MTTVQVTQPHLCSDQVEAEIAGYPATGISDACAVTIASWWQSPGRVGHVLASFASGCAVDAQALADDVEATIIAAGAEAAVSDLNALAAWVRAGISAVARAVAWNAVLADDGIAAANAKMIARWTRND